MKITPIDVQQQSFTKKFRGVDGQEVASYLELVAAELEEMITENRNLKNELALKEREISLYKEQEAAIKETMVAAQKANDELREQARREADIMLSDAELKAEKIVANAHNRMIQEMEELGNLKRQKIQFREALKGLLAAHNRILTLDDELAEEESQDANVAFIQRANRFDESQENSAISMVAAV